MKGQALLELSLVVTLFGLLLVWAVPLLNDHLSERAETQEKAQIILRQAPWRNEQKIEPLSFERLHINYGYQQRDLPDVALTVTDQYALAAQTSSLWNLMGSASALAMPMKNLHTLSIKRVGQEHEWMRFVRLADDWSPRHVDHLVQRPQKLTSSHLFEAIGVHQLQQFLAILPFAKELHSNQLKLGYIAVDVVPKRAVCEIEPCHD